MHSVIEMFLVASPIVINVPTRGLLAVETMHAIVQLNIRKKYDVNVCKQETSLYSNLVTGVYLSPAPSSERESGTGGIENLGTRLVIALVKQLRLVFDQSIQSLLFRPPRESIRRYFVRKIQSRAIIRNFVSTWFEAG